MSRPDHPLVNHPEIQALIPWLVNGTLDASELDRVNRHIAHCQACADSVQQEMALARRVSAEIPAASRWEARRQESLAALQEQIPRHGNKNHRSARPPRRYRLPGAVAALVLTGIALAWISLPSQDSRYRTLTEPPETGGPLVQVVFSPHATEGSIRELLNGHGASVVSGPGPTGVYRIRLPDPADTEAVVDSLARHPATRLVLVER